MRLLDFLRRKEPDREPQNAELLAALKIENMAPSPATRANLLRVLSRSTVCVAVRELPPELSGEGPFVLQDDVRFTPLTSTNRQGQTVALVFSDHQHVQARKSGAASIEMTVQQAARNALLNGKEGMIINPAGDWVELTREEVEHLAQTQSP